MTDIHSHILYGLDDGAQTRAESKAMLEAAKAAGVDRIVATPHARRLPVDRALAQARLQELRTFSEADGIRLYLGYELHWNVLLALTEADYTDYCLPGGSTMLLEFSLTMAEAPQGHEQRIYRLQRDGFHIVIAHPERYPFVRRRPDVAERWHDMGCELQCDASCLRRDREFGSKRAARRLFERDLYDYFASDAHCAGDYERFGKAMEWVDKHSN